LEHLLCLLRLQTERIIKPNTFGNFAMQSVLDTQLNVQQCRVCRVVALINKCIY
jgi:hypothetical protein